MDTRSLNLTHTRKITLAQYSRWYMMQSSHLHRGKKLYQQLIVDTWAREEARHFEWRRNSQKTIQADLYSGLHDAHQGNELDCSGSIYILPSTFTGSDRWYDKWYKNAMYHVIKFGVPTFFITTTMDISCKESVGQLNPGETPYDRPDIFNRVFELKRKELLHQIKKDGLFGHCIAHVCVIEFHKTGAPQYALACVD